MNRARAFSPLALLMLLGACAPGTGEASDPAGNSSPPPCPETIEIAGFDFEPASCSVESGAQVTFVNNDDVPHTATSDDGAAGSFDTGTLQPGESATVTLDEAGAYPYFCQIHPSMQASIEVIGASEATGTSSGLGY